MLFLLFLLLMLWMCLAGCEIWIREEGVASFTGTLYPYTSLSDCLKLCLETSTCVAVDVSVYLCVVHTNMIDRDVPLDDFTRYTLNRACQSSTATTQTTVQTMYFGNCRTVYTM